MSSRRILILTNRVPYPLSDGGNLAMKAMIDGYRDEGWDVCLLTMNTSRHYVEPRIIHSAYPGVRVEIVDVNNDVKPIPALMNYLLDSLPNHAARFNKPEFRQRLVELLNELKPDVVQLESVFLSEYLPEIRKTTGLAVLRMHNVEWQVWARVARETKSLVKKIYLQDLAKRIRKYEQRVWAQFDLLLAITEVDAAIAKTYNDKVLTVPFGVDTTNVREVQLARDWKAYHLGAMDWLPNAEAISWFLKEIWPAIRQKNPSLTFYYAGRNMPDSFRTMNIPGAICAGEVPNADEFIADKNILVVPLRSGGGIRVKILEAMAAGKLVVSTTVGMQGIEAVAGKHYFQANNPGEFTKALSRIVADPAMARQIAMNGQELATGRYDRHHIAHRLAEELGYMLKNKTV
ncbi:glycosyltransferase [Polluticoccus soli]|uniref:glycosyltransferase n=1 Tax=Polluticoccus soli TaxID=3034150 RepID=UPI0023E0BE0D|nr:glycosyltransferase [Flavipsychrobacter sp. JY13-12]